MLITIKPAMGKEFDIEINGDETVEEIKKKIATQLKTEYTRLRLISNGKVLSKLNNKLAEYGVKNKDIVNVMIGKVILFNYNSGCSKKARE